MNPNKHKELIVQVFSDLVVGEQFLLCCLSFYIRFILIVNVIHYFPVICSGVVVGAIIHYVSTDSPPKMFKLTRDNPQFFECNSTDIDPESNNNTLTVGEVVHLTSRGDSFSCTVGGKLFKDDQGNFIQESVSKS